MVSRFLFLGIGLALILFAAAVLTLAPAQNPSTGQMSLEAQAAALRPEAAGDIQALSSAPRYRISAEVDPQNGSAAGQVQVNFTNPSDEPLPDLVFRLYPNASSIYGGGSLRVDGVRQGETPLETELSEAETVLRVLLPNPLPPGETATVVLSFTAQAPETLGEGYGIFNRAGRVFSLAGWYPMLAAYQDGWLAPPVPVVGDALLADISFYEVELEVPAGYQVVSTGVVVSSSTIRGSTASPTNLPASGTQSPLSTLHSPTTWRLVSGPVREFAAAVSQEFEMLETLVDGVTLRIYTLPAEEPVATAEEGLDRMAEAFQAYTERFGPYPYTELDLVETTITIGGYEFPGMVYLDDELRASGERASYEYLLAHELAHQWWYNLVGTQTVAEPWLDEAHATYGAVLAFEHADHPEAAQSLLARWQEAVALQEGIGGINSPASEFRDWGHYRDTIYTKGALFLHELRQEMGDENFFALLQRFQETYRYRRAGTTEYLKLAEELAGKDLGELFEKYF